MDTDPEDSSPCRPAAHTLVVPPTDAANTKGFDVTWCVMCGVVTKLTVSEGTECINFLQTTSDEIQDHCDNDFDDDNECANAPQPVPDEEKWMGSAEEMSNVVDEFSGVLHNAKNVTFVKDDDGDFDLIRIAISNARDWWSLVGKKRTDSVA